MKSYGMRSWNDALQAEAYGALEALQYVMSMEISNVELEVDAVNLWEG